MKINFTPFLPETSIDEIPLSERSGHSAYSFHANLSYTYKDIFPEMDNYDVEDRLWERGVIGQDDFRDSESCELVVYFLNYVNAANFIVRLNEYIQKKIEKFEDALNY